MLQTTSCYIPYDLLYGTWQSENISGSIFDLRIVSSKSTNLLYSPERLVQKLAIFPFFYAMKPLSVIQLFGLVKKLFNG